MDDLESSQTLVCFLFEFEFTSLNYSDSWHSGRQRCISTFWLYLGQTLETAHKLLFTCKQSDIWGANRRTHFSWTCLFYRHHHFSPGRLVWIWYPSVLLHFGFIFSPYWKDNNYFPHMFMSQTFSAVWRRVSKQDATPSVNREEHRLVTPHILVLVTSHNWHQTHS